MDLASSAVYKASSDKQELEVQLKYRTKQRLEISKVDVGRYRLLIRAMLENNVKAQREFLDKNPEALTAEIDEFGNTIFHFIVQESVNMATIALLKELVSKSEDSSKTLEIVNVNGLTALHIAASAGNTEATRVLVEKNTMLLNKKDDTGFLPVHHAANWCRKETVRYLMSVTTHVFADGNPDGALLLQLLIESNLHGLALELLKHYPQLLAKPDENVLWGTTVNRLAEKYLAFKSGRKLGLWESFIYTNIPVNDDDEDHIAWPDTSSVNSDDEDHVASPDTTPVNDDDDDQDHNVDVEIQVKDDHQDHNVDVEIQVKDDHQDHVARLDSTPVNDDDQDHVIDIEIQVKYDQDHVARPPDSDNIVMLNHTSSSTNRLKKILTTLQQIAAAIGALLLWNPLIQLVPRIKRIHDQKQMHSQTLEIVRMMVSKEVWTYQTAADNLKEPVLTAARLGIHEFVNEVLKAYPNSVLLYNEEGHNIFLLAVLHRKENVFSLIHDQVASIRDHTNYLQDNKGCNILHLAGRLVPSNQVPGAALQMQRELQWFTGIRDLFQPSLQEQYNESGDTPGEVFTKSHEKLVEKGEKWMRDTATSCSVVAALIITIVFAAAVTVPGGINPNGIPNYLDNTYFRIFAVSVALALFASTTAVQMFLGMLTSRYAEVDFLKALPKKLIIGLMTLFLSSTCMMVAFGAAFCIVLSHPWKWVIILICLLGCLPVTLFAWMQFPLLVDIFKSTYGPGILRPKKYM